MRNKVHKSENNFFFFRCKPSSIFISKIKYQTNKVLVGDSQNWMELSVFFFFSFYLNPSQVPNFSHSILVFFKILFYFLHAIWEAHLFYFFIENRSEKQRNILSSKEDKIKASCCVLIQL